jgi:hypothetical protein
MTRTAVRLIRATGGQRMVKEHAANGAAVQVLVKLSQLEQTNLKPSEQDDIARARVKEALLEIAGKL